MLAPRFVVLRSLFTSLPHPPAAADVGLGEVGMAEVVRVFGFVGAAGLGGDLCPRTLEAGVEKVSAGADGDVLVRGRVE